MVLKNIPMPPTSNHAFKRGMGFKDYPSEHMLKFQKNFDIWKLRNEYSLGIVRNHISHELAKTPNIDLEKLIIYGKLHIERKFFFSRETLFFKNGNKKKMDLTNRIKYLDDYVCRALQIDDNLIMSGSEETFLDNQDYVNVMITVKYRNDTQCIEY